MYCSKCGNQLTEIDKFCPKCGTSVNNIEPNNEIPTDTEHNNNNSIPRNRLIFAIILIVMIFVILFGVNKYIKSNHSNNQNATNGSGIEITETSAIEQAVKDGMLSKEYLTTGITSEEVYYEFFQGNMNKYYTRWEAFLTDADRLGILRHNDEI